MATLYCCRSSAFSLLSWVFMASKEGEKKSLAHTISFPHFCSFMRCFFERVWQTFFGSAKLQKQKKGDKKILLAPSFSDGNASGIQIIFFSGSTQTSHIDDYLG